MPVIPDKTCFERIICHGAGLWDPCKEFEKCAAAPLPRIKRIEVVPAKNLTAQVETERDGIKLRNISWCTNGTAEVFDTLGIESKHITEIHKELPHLRRNWIRNALSNLKKALRADNPRRGYWCRTGNEKMNNV